MQNIVSISKKQRQNENGSFLIVMAYFTGNEYVGQCVVGQYVEWSIV